MWVCVWEEGYRLTGQGRAILPRGQRSREVHKLPSRPDFAQTDFQASEFSLISSFSSINRVIPSLQHIISLSTNAITGILEKNNNIEKKCQPKGNLLSESMVDWVSVFFTVFRDALFSKLTLRIHGTNLVFALNRVLICNLFQKQIQTSTTDSRH